MSSDLYEREIADRLEGFEPVNRVEPGAFDGFLRGTGLSAMHALARTGAGVDIVGALGPIAQDTITGGTEAQDRYFKEHDELYGRAMEFWTPKPDEVGIAGQITGELLTMIPMVVASPGLTVAGLQVGEALELMRRGAGWKEALGVGTVQAAGLGLGIYVPILGRTLAQRVLLGGAGFNIIQGAGTRGASELVLKDHPALAQIYGALDPAYLTMDILLGLAFGGLAHVSPAMRAQGGEALVRLEKWLQGADSATKDALATMRQAQHLGADSLPGRPVEPKDAAFHVERVRRAIEQAARNEPVDVSDIPEPKTEPLPEIQAERAANLEQLVAAAEEVRVAEDLPAAPEEPVAPRRFVAENLTLVPVEQQARVLGQAVENRLLELKLDEGQAKANAALWEAFFETTSRKYGVRVDALLATYGIDVRRMSRADLEQMMPEALAQQELDRPAAKARVDELKRLIEPLARKGELTKTEADRYEGLVREMEGIRHTLAKPARAEDVASAAERKSTLSAKVSATAYNDLLGNREVFAAIREAAAGARFDRATAVDRIVSGENARVTARQLYDAFASTRQALREQYGPSLTLYRATGKQRRKPTTNWATTRAFAEQFGKDIITKQVLIDNVLAVHTTKAGKYHEVIVVDKPPERALSGMPLFQALERGAIRIGPETVIGLFEKADASTFAHESAHLFLTMTRDLASRGGAPLEALQDWSTLAKWLKLEGGEITRAQQEQFATGFERYLAEGKAPSEELRSVFQQFRDWLIQIYRSVAAIAEDLPDEIRGVMDRMLASERRDPTPKAKGPPPAEAEPPPPPGEAGAAGRPEARGIDQDWRARMGEPSAPARVVPTLPLADPAIAGKVDLMLAAELGWEQIGGRRARADISRSSGQPNFTEWIPKSELWPSRPAKHLNEAQVRRAVEKARAGERLGTAEQATVDYLVRLANERMADIEAIGGPEEWNAAAREAADAGLEPSTQTIQDVDAIARASQADELAVERAAQKYENDEPAFMAEIRRILGKEKPRAAEAPGERAPEGGAQTRGEQAGRRGEPQEPDPLREAALRVVEADPERLIPVGTDADGNPTYKTLRQYLDDELLDAADAREDANLVRAAAQCLYGKG
jgi:hypothetical protein